HSQMHDEIEKLKSNLNSSSDLESKVDYLYQICKLQQKIEKFQDAYENAKKLSPFLEKETFNKSIKRKVYQLIANLALVNENWLDAMFYGRKWLEHLDEHDSELLVDCYLILLKAHYKGNDLHESCVNMAKKCRDICEVLGFSE